MIQIQTRLKVLDNSGAKEVQCIQILGSNNPSHAFVGDKIVVSVKKVLSIKNVETLKHSRVKKGEIYHAIIVRSSKNEKLKDGSLICFSDNAVVLINKNEELLGTRVRGIVSYQLRMIKQMKILSLVKYIV